MQSILIVEDEKRVADLLKAGLEENGYSVMVAYDGEMGLRLFRSNEFHLVISDIVLPGVDGFGLCKEIRKINSDVPVLMLTALGSTDDKLDGFDAGADDYMLKPFDFRELNARIRVLLKRYSSPQIVRPDFISYSDISINLNTCEVTRAGVQIKLSPKEYNLLVYMVENSPDRISFVQISFWDKWTVVRMSDNGTGLSDDERQNMFKLFYRGKQEHIAAGHGIGMALAQKIINLHHGKINVLSDEGKGTTFVVEMQHL